MKNKERLKLHNHLFVQMCVSFGAILVLFSIVISIVFSNLYEDNVIAIYSKQLKYQARRVASDMTKYVSEKDTGSAFDYQEYLESMENSDAVDIWLIDNQDDEIKLEKEFINADIEDIQLSDEVVQVLNAAKIGNVTYASGYNDIYEMTMMYVAAPYYNEKHQVVGIVLLNSLVEQRDSLLQSSKKYILYSIVAGIILALALALILATIITRPLGKMRHVAYQLADGAYDKRTNVKARNEIGILARSMDTLAMRLEENEKERKENEQLRLDFFSNVSHELRTPITVIRGYSESLLDGVVKEEKKQQYYDRMVMECESMERLVGDLLTLSKVQNPHFTIEKEPVNLVQIFGDVMRNYKSVADQKKLAIELSCQKDIVMMLGDYDRLRQLFNNIVENAIKFSGEGGTIWITVEEQSEIIVKIKDEGIGISTEELPNIFDKFYKSKLRQNKKGSGLGLVIAKNIVEKHKGTIEVKSALGEGAEFIIRFQKEKEAWSVEE